MWVVWLVWSSICFLTFDWIVWQNVANKPFSYFLGIIKLLPQLKYIENSFKAMRSIQILAWQFETMQKVWLYDKHRTKIIVIILSDWDSAWYDFAMFFLLCLIFD